MTETVSANPMVGSLIFALGGLAGAVFAVPFRKVKGWAYESWWLVYAFVGLIVCPPVICYFTVPDFCRTAVFPNCCLTAWTRLSRSTARILRRRS